MKKTSVISLLGVSLLLFCLVYPVSAVGIFRNSTGNWYLDYNNTGVIDKSLHFGGADDSPVVGNWGGTGRDGIAIFRPSTGYWYFDYNLDGTVDKSFRYGGSTDRIIVGKWNSTLQDGIAIFRPSTGYWYFDYNLDGTADKSFRYGGSTDRIIKGDWNGDGKDGIAIFRPSTGYWYFDYNLDGTVDKSFRYGGSTDRIIVGKWNSTLQDGIAIFRPSTGYWYFDYNLNGTVDKSFRYGGSTDRIIKGDWNGDGKDGIAIFRPSTGNWYLDYNLDGKVDKSFRYGGSTDQIFVGGWGSVAPVAAFTSDVQSGYAPLFVRFTNRSTGTAPLTYAWDFNNDGEVDSSEPSPNYTYEEPGKYTVNLTVSNGAGNDSEQKANYITVTPAPVAPSAAFTSVEHSGYAPLFVRFINQSTGTAPLTYAWDFNNDGEVDSSEPSPVYTYILPGIYTVNLTVTNGIGTDSEIKNGYIAVYEFPVPPAANFIVNKRSGVAPLTVIFTDCSTGTAPMEYAWDFDDDGDIDSYLINPTFTYTTPGTYSVTLTVTNELDTDVERKTGYITVTEGQPGGSHAGVAITFDDRSIDQWYAIQGLLNQYNAKVTFFVSGFENLEYDEIDKLRMLQADGHEIGYHGLYHTDAAAYLTTHSVQQYLEYDIIPGVNLMKNAGFNPVDFAYPFGHDNPAATAALQEYFRHIRDTSYSWDETIYYEYGSNQTFISGVGIDDVSYGYTIEDIYDGISIAKQEDTILILYSHTPVQNVTGDYQLSFERLEKILKNVSDNEMKFYTVSELT